jgi:hypothetical protein
MATALVSALTKIAVRRDVAMTGEITLRGRVLPIGGLKEKMLAAIRAGITTIIIPEQNRKDLDEIPKHILKKIKIVSAANIDESETGIGKISAVSNHRQEHSQQAEGTCPPGSIIAKGSFLKDGTDLTKLGEFGLIDRIARQIAARSEVVLGIGDDAAAFTPSPGRLSLITTDMLVEGIHFDLRSATPVPGEKGPVGQSFRYCRNGRRTTVFSALVAIPPTMTLDFVDSCINGMLQQAEQFGVQLIGGDTCASPGTFVLTLTVLGSNPGKIVRRSGAHPG